MDIHLTAVLQPRHYQVKSIPTLAYSDTSFYLVALILFLTLKRQRVQIDLQVFGWAAQLGSVQADSSFLAPGCGA